jgi:energy-coupling factor transport system ATP-binding protein
VAIELKDIAFTYLPGTPMARQVLADIDLELKPGEILCLMGKTGTGKSTLLQIICGLLTPTAGSIALDGQVIGPSRAESIQLKRAANILMQSPEKQLFAETVGQDVSFGPRNLGLAGSELAERVREALRAVGLDPDTYVDRSTFHLSQGEMRRVALAGILAMKPRYLLLDEPSSALDPPGRDALYLTLRNLRDEGNGVLLVTHDWEEVELLADRVALLSQGNILASGDKQLVLTSLEEIARAGLQPPPLVMVLAELRRKGIEIPSYAASPEEAADLIAASLKGGGP